MQPRPPGLDVRSPAFGRRVRAGFCALLLGTGAALAVDVPRPDLSGVEGPVRAKVSAAAGAVEKEPGNAAAWGRYGMILDAHRLTAEAATAYREAARLDPGEMRWAYYLATLLEYEDPTEAAQWYARAIELRPSYGPARVRYAQTLENLGRDDEALVQYGRAAELQPDDALPPLGLGRIALSQGRTTDAVRELERAYRLAPGIQAVVASLARAYARAGRTEEARQKAEEARGLPRALPHLDPLRAAVQDEAVDAESYLRRARTYTDVGNLERARHEIEALLESRPDSAEGWFAAAGIYDRLGLAQEALRASEETLALDPNLPGAAAVRAGALLKLQRFEEAEEAARAVLESDPDNLHMLVIVAMAAGQRGALDEMVEQLDHAYAVRTRESAMGPVLVQLLGDLAAVFADAGRFEEAATRMAQALEVALESGAPPATVRQMRQQVERYRAGQAR